MRVFPLILFSFIGAVAMAKDINSERLMSKDTDKDGRLSRQELGELFWQRSAGQDANGDGFLDATEVDALLTKGRRGKTEKDRPGGANIAFQVREFTATNGETLRYSLFIPAERSDTPLPLVLCLHGAGGNTDAANLLASAERQMQHPCLIMAPACDGKSARWAKSAFRGGDGRVVMPEMIEALRKAEVKPEPKYTEFPGVGHGSAGPAYDTADLWEWMFAQKRVSP